MSSALDTELGEPGGPADEKQDSLPKPEKDCLLAFCRTVNFVTGFAAFLCLVAHAMALSVASHRGSSGVGPPQSPWESLEIIRIQVLRLYSIGAALIIMLVETESVWISSWFKASYHWVGRGILQGFLAVLTLELASSKGSSDFDRSLHIYRQVAGVSMLGCGAFYLLGGVLCVGALKQVRTSKAQERAKAEEELLAVEAKRETLRAKLAAFAKR